MRIEFLALIKEVTGASEIIELEKIQDLWSGYGTPFKRDYALENQFF